jgi:hypothetical protein
LFDKSIVAVTPAVVEAATLVPSDFLMNILPALKVSPSAPNAFRLSKVNTVLVDALVILEVAFVV